MMSGGDLIKSLAQISSGDSQFVTRISMGRAMVPEFYQLVVFFHMENLIGSWTLSPHLGGGYDCYKHTYKVIIITDVGVL